ncbi:hypothetical protein N7509_004981 [Penicillium cosmopolitanum]|uniref:Uncharacterized protein n=1 Tax=Penicillium cosmopolitanum TaxID=1131564 RepID=A0A9W9W1K2_9EURO|nr:uncharacterized protein N7509_004981 [Penicillium cosmopolitanum]KAJ5396868.1 hypothetical protein N7509_004981 [Penicillium cosmopolitanum]
MPTDISILVFVASPLDYARYRHTALFFDFAQTQRQETDKKDHPAVLENGINTQTGNELRLKNAGNAGADVDGSPSPSTDPASSSSSSPSFEVKSCLMEITGSPGFYNFAEHINSDIPISSSSTFQPPPSLSKPTQTTANPTRLSNTALARVIPVSSIKTAPPPALRLITSETPIPIDIAEEMDWNSQNWVGDALGRLVTAGYLDTKDRDRALDEMVDVVLEAKDEETSGSL